MGSRTVPERRLCIGLILAHGIKDGDEVIVPSFTFIATANAPLFVGARPVFADIETRTFGLDPEDVARRITSRTKAIMPIHYGGAPCEIEPLARVASDHKILLIEDAAESIGASVDGRSVGHFGDSAMLSFCGNKVITTGEGGVVVTDSPELADRLRLFRSHGRLESEPYFQTVKSLDSHRTRVQLANVEYYCKPWYLADAETPESDRAKAREGQGALRQTFQTFRTWSSLG